jgi:hypothetical protein
MDAASLRIAMLAPPFVRVPPRGYGGVERVVTAIAGQAGEREDL